MPSTSFPRNDSRGKGESGWADSAFTFISKEHAPNNMGDSTGSFNCLSWLSGRSLPSSCSRSSTECRVRARRCILGLACGMRCARVTMPSQVLRAK
eukprot:2887749-Pyramimonas_sp.AAC.1